VTGRPPTPPYLDLSFYYSNIAESDAFASLAMSLLARDARFIEASVIQGSGSRARHCGRDVLTSADTVLPITSEEAILNALRNPDTKVSRLTVERALPHTPGVEEHLTYIPLQTENAIREDQHPIVLVAEGDAWDFDSADPHAEQKHRRACWAGREAYELLRALTMETRPAYAAIAVERTVESPADLRDAPEEATAFSDFFVADGYVGGDAIDDIRRLFDGAHIEEWADGIYVSCIPYFNPTQTRRVGSLREPMAAVATLLGNAPNAMAFA
jgi:hypothetical protein